MLLKTTLPSRSARPFTSPADSKNPTGGEPSTTVSRVLQRAGKDPAVIDEILPMVYEELQRIAGLALRKERREHTLSATALVHEAYLRLCGSEPTSFEGRRHFFAAAALAMRRVLVDHARRQLADKRIPRGQIVPLEKTPEPALALDLDLLALDEALGALARINGRMAKTVELRYFAGLTEAQTAELLDVSPVTVRRDWATAKVWLRRKMER